MIIKVKIGKTFKGCVNYVLGKEGASVLQANQVSDEVVQHIVQDFKMVSAIRPTIKNVVWHTSASFAHTDKVNDDLMRNVAEDYLTAMGLIDHQYLIVKHTDTKHAHFHIVANRIGLNGNVADDSWCKNRSAAMSDKLEQKYKLTVATLVGRNSVYKGEGKLKGKAQAKLDAKNFIKQAIDECSPDIVSFEELSTELLTKGIEVQLQKRSDGAVNGISFRTNEMAIKGSSIHKNYRAKAFIERFEKVLMKKSQKRSHKIR